LGNTGIHVRSANRGNVFAYVEASVNQEFSVLSALHVPNINPNDSHIGFWRNIDNPWFGCKGNVVENVVLFEDIFNVGRGKLILRILVGVERKRNSCDFQV